MGSSELTGINDMRTVKKMDTEAPSRSEKDWRVMFDCGREGDADASSLAGTSNSMGVPDR